MTDLQGLHLLVTRPQEQALPWAEKLTSLGADVTCQPMLSIKAVDDQVSKQLIATQIMMLDEYQKVIFVSQNAVSAGVSWIDEYWPQLPSGLTVFAIGSTTAALLADKLSLFGGSIISPKAAMNSEDLLALAELVSVKGEKILIMRGKGGRTHLGDSLKEKGALVDYCELYHRVIPDTIDQQKISAFRSSHSTPVIITHSGETLANLCTVLTSTNAPTNAANNENDDLPWFKQQALLVPGKRVAEKAEALGFKHIIIAENATHESMIGALHDWRQNND
ncbi:MAG: uroporphyrinogen-III synthase [Cellvibrionaceae bacterium]